MSYCVKCGAPLPPGASFCPKCGTAVVVEQQAPPPPAQPPRVAVPPPPPRTAAPPAAPKGSRWWIAPAVVLGLVVVAFLVLAGLPFGRDEGEARPAPQTDTIAESTAPAPSATIVEVPGEADESFEIATTTTQSPPATATVAAPTTTFPPPTATVAPPTTTVAPPPRREQPRREQPPVRVVPKPQAEITASEASSTLRSYVISRRYYPAASECIRVENRGYRNVGYNLEVWHSCSGGGASRLLGRWRVDSKTRELFVQRDDGRYLRP